MITSTHFYNGCIRHKLPLLAVMALMASVLSSGQAWAHDDELEVTGSYNTLFTQFEFLGQGDGLVNFDVTLQGSFVLMIEDVVRSGTITFPHILRVPVDGPTRLIPGLIRGSSAWIFDDGTNCVGFQGGLALSDGAATEGEFQCSDGTTLSLTITDTASEGGIVTADIKGVLLIEEADDDDDDD